MASNITLPNPYTPLAFLEPTLADQFQVSCYLYVAGLSAFVWDWFMSMPDEYRIFRQSKLSIPNIAYFISRLSTLGYCITAVVFQAAPVAHCQPLLEVIGVCIAVALPSTALLFFFRVKAVYSNSKYITGTFGFMWVALLGLSILAPLSVEGDHIGPTQRCINTLVRPFASVPIAFNAFYDTAIFLAISFRIVSYSVVGDTWGARLKSFYRGQGLPRMSKGLLQGGQLYYFVTIGFAIFTTAMILAPSVPAVYHAMFTVPNLVLECTMACRVFRAVKLGFIKDTPVTSHFVTSNQKDIALTQRTFENSRNVQVNVEITSTTDRDDVSEGFAYGKKTELVEEDAFRRV